jgi:hypothetical protein
MAANELGIAENLECPAIIFAQRRALFLDRF